MKKKILIVIGDPISINSEILYKSWKKIDSSLRKKIILISFLKLWRILTAPLKRKLIFIVKCHILLEVRGNRKHSYAMELHVILFTMLMFLIRKIGYITFIPTSK